MSEVCHLACAHCAALNKFPLERIQDKPKCGKCKQGVVAQAPVTLTNQNFSAHVQNGDLPVLVDFWAPWCGPCQMMAPYFASAAEQLQGMTVLGKLDTEANPELGARFNIRSIPTLVLFHRGKEIARQSGVMTAKDLVAWVKQTIA